MHGSLIHDFRDAFRFFRKNQALVGGCIIILALAIGCNTAVFSIVNTVLLKSLPFPASNKLVFLAMTDAKRGLAEGSFSYGRWQQLKNGTHSFSDVSVFCRENLNLTGTDRPEQLHAL